MKRFYKKSLYKIFVSFFVIFYSFVPQVIAMEGVIETLQEDYAASVEEVNEGGTEETTGEEEVIIEETEVVEEVVLEEPQEEEKQEEGLVPMEIKTFQVESIYEPDFTGKCVIDLQGANDEPGQKDLNQMCIDETMESEGDLYVTWNWDDIKWTGTNTGNACSLFDTDNDGYANYSLCVVVAGSPATYQDTILYSCGDASASKCTNPILSISMLGGTSCSAAVQSTDPFSGPAAKDTGDYYPNDTVASCNINLDDVGGVLDAKLIDVCSYPSNQPNSDPSDCIVYAPKMGTLEVVKDLYPANDSGLFNLLIEGEIFASNVGDGGSTGEISLSAGTHAISETAGTDTNLSLYTSSISCKDAAGATVAQGEGTSLDVPIGEGEDILCTITNSRLSGSIQVNKYLDRDGDGSFEEANPTDYTWSIDGSGTYTMGDKVDGLATGTHSVNESTPPTGFEFKGWYPNTAAAGFSCESLPQGDMYKQLPISVNVQADPVAEITLCNAAIPGKLIVQKITNPSGDITEFPIDISTTDGHVWGSTSGVITDVDDYTYTVGVGTYSVTETVPEGWYMDSNTCKNIEVGPGEEKSCTITNIKYGSISGHKYNDLDGLASTTDDREEVVGWRIDLYKEISDTEYQYVGFRLTDSLGKYLFEDLKPGDYQLREVVEVGWIELSVKTLDVSLEAGEEDTDNDFINVQLGEIEVCKYEDVNGNGQKDTADFPLEGIPFILYSYIKDEWVQKNTGETLKDGCYTFENLYPGTYRVVEDYTSPVLEDYYSSNSTTYKDFEIAGNEISFDFLNAKYRTISGMKFEDMNGNGIKDAEDFGLSGWTIFLDTDGDGIFDIDELSRVTDSTGYYEFSNLASDSYRVREVLQGGWTQTSPSIGYHDIDLHTEYTGTGLNFGNFEHGTAKVCKVDSEGDPISGWKVYLNQEEQITGEDGCTIFTIVLPGPYVVTEDTPKGWTPVSDTFFNFTAESGGKYGPYTFSNFEHVTINVIKDVLDPDDFDIVDTHSFTVQLNGANSKTISEVISASYTIENPGTYTVSELNDPNYEELGCFISEGVLATDFEVESGETYNVVCLNRQIQGSLTLVKHITQDDGGNEIAEDFNVYINGELSTWGTHSLNPGTYTPTEDVYPGYEAGSWHCVDNNLPKGEMTVLIPVVLGTNQDVTCTITNDDIAPTITLIKHVITNYGGEAGEDDFGLTIGTEEVYSGEELAVLANTEYAIDEEGLHGYDFVKIEGNEKCPDVLKGTVVLNEGEDITCTIFNEDLPATIEVYKDVIDWNGESEVYSDQIFKVVLTDEDIPFQEISDSEESPSNAKFENLDAGYYTPTEINIPDGYGFNGCTIEEPIFDDSPSMVVNNYIGTYVGNGKTVTFVCENQVIQPQLEITKTNNSESLYPTAGVYAGDTFEYTIIVTAPEVEDDGGTYIVKDVRVRDIIPAGFTYNGTWSSSSTNTALEQPYGANTPGVWYLGDMTEGDSISITYSVRISLLQDTGIYKDIAYTYGDSILGEGMGDVLGVSATDSSTNFVGTEVLVIEPVELEEGEVLGASIELPQTGAETYLTLGALISMVLGLILLLFNPKRKIKNLVIAGVLLLGIFTFVKPLPAYALSDLNVRIEEPTSPTNVDNFKIGFVALDIQGRTLEIKCYEGGTAFGPTYTTSSGNCVVDSTIVTGSGTYTFYVVAKVQGEAESVTSQTVTMVVDLGKPLPVTNYEKDEGVCSNTLTFKTANDGRTSKIQIFRSSTQPFTANATTLIKEMTVGPNVTVTYTDTPLPNCSTEYYYAIRSLDSFNNTSTFVTDDIVTVVIVPASPTETDTDTDTDENGEVAGEEVVDDESDGIGGNGEDEEVTDDDGEVAGEDIDDEDGETTDDENEGESEEEQSFWDEYKYVIIFLGVVLLSSVGYIYVKRRK
ncbi:MAG: hypothetical protein UR61_C0042G0001 [candidate division WS6 bacterium GW2011_GWE1_34_7]|uniref:Uncharacterized protein n=1 Tax=candidate division WS6 bacterium GW2011_GWE1_34_7 TaxID=1619093 RepID=A0A0G0B5P4_9BACT|nr:MAG: hypothetical protein UR61_C0042G0001 [candidate division WS6 bacterium GW2011_GWE1_34_7]